MYNHRNAMREMDKDGKILLVETDTHACAQLGEVLNTLHIPNEVVCFSNAAQASEYLNKNYKDVFLVLQNVASPGLQLPNSRNMVYMHEKFNIPEVAYVFLIHPHAPAGQTRHTFLQCYYRGTDTGSLKKVFSEMVTYWKAQVFNPMQLRTDNGG